MKGLKRGVPCANDTDDWDFHGSPLSCSEVEKRM